MSGERAEFGLSREIPVDLAVSMRDSLRRIVAKELGNNKNAKEKLFREVTPGDVAEVDNFEITIPERKIDDIMIEGEDMEAFTRYRVIDSDFLKIRTAVHVGADRVLTPVLYSVTVAPSSREDDALGSKITIGEGHNPPATADSLLDNKALEDAAFNLAIATQELTDE